MSPTVTSVDQIDLDISIAFIALGAARTAFFEVWPGRT